MLEQLATAWRERNLVTEEHWSTAAGDLKKKRDQLNRLVSALHRRRANGMTAYEAFGRVVADRDRLADIGLTWPAGTVHSPEQLAQMRETCADIRTALEAIGDPAVHPLAGHRTDPMEPGLGADVAADHRPPPGHAAADAGRGRCARHLSRAERDRRRRSVAAAC